jgi:hypothetical protein
MRRDAASRCDRASRFRPSSQGGSRANNDHLSQQRVRLLLFPARKLERPQLLIRNPKWTEEKPYQDIPIMVFTPAEWQQVEAVTMSVSAAPIGPSELGHNSQYVFALPPRWIGFDDTLGQDEVSAWTSQNRLQAPCGKTTALPGKNIP